MANILLSWSSLDKSLNRWDLKNVKWIMIIHLTKTFQMLIERKLYNQKDFARCFSDRKGPWLTFCCLGHSDVNSHFKNFNPLNTFFTLCEPHKLKHTLSTLSSKRDSMCHRRTCVGQKFISENPSREFQVFREFQVITMVFSDCFTCINENVGFV